MNTERYCPSCEEFYTVTERDAELDYMVHGCGDDGIPADQANVKSDAETYAQENPR